MKRLIEALMILLKYHNEGSFHSSYPTHCEHDELNVFVDNPVSDEDVARLDELGFGQDEDEPTRFYSYEFGSC